MAKAKRKAGGGGDSKQALTIILVFFVLLAIITGVVAYYGYAEQEDLRKKIVDARRESDVVKKDRAKERYMKSFYKVLGGFGVQNKDDSNLDDTSNVTALKSQYEKDMNDEIDRLKKDYYKDLNWDAAGNKPAITLVARIAELEKDRADLQTKLTVAEDAAKTANKEKQDAITKADADRAALQTKLTDSEAKLKDISNMKSDALNTALKQNADLQNDKEDALRKSQQAREGLEKQVADLQKENKELMVKAKTLQEKVAPINLLNHLEPKGEVLTVDRATGQTVYINLGSLDRVKENLTFSIYPRGVKPKPGVERKGSLEVVQVLGAHQSKCRVTEVVSANRDPIMPGDQLYNPTWSPTLREHVAIAGNIDLSGDGSDDSAELVRNLEKQGIIVDAYLDPRDGTVKGRGLSGETNYLVLGAEIPQHQDKIMEIRRQAAAQGVTVVPARRYLALIGYRLPPGTTGGDWKVSSVLTPGPAAAPMENPAPGDGR